jgi:hypothetical protein
MRGRLDDAVAHHEAAIPFHEQLRARPWAADPATTWRAPSSLGGDRVTGNEPWGCSTTPSRPRTRSECPSSSKRY